MSARLRNAFSAVLVSLALFGLLTGPAQALDAAQRTVLFGQPGWVLKGAKVDINFAKNQLYGCASLTSCLSITNSTGGYVTNADGTLTLIPANTLRIGAGTGLLVEQGSTNLARQSGNLVTSWGSVNLTRSANTGTATPDNSSKYSVFTEGTTASVAWNTFLTAGVTVSSGATVTLSVFIYPGTRRYVDVEINGDITHGVGVCFDTVGLTGATYVYGAGASATSYSIVAVANGGYRVAITGSISGYTTYFPAIGGALVSSGGASGVNTNYTGTSSTFNAWGIQLEPLAFPTSYIPTVASSVDRSADNISMAGALATLLANPTGSIVVKTNGLIQSATATLVDANGTVLLGKTSGNAGTTAVGATLSTGNTATWTGANDLGLAWNAAGGAIQLNGGTIATDTQARTPSGTFHVGSTSGSSAFQNGYTTRLAGFSSKVTSPQ